MFPAVLDIITVAQHFCSEAVPLKGCLELVALEKLGSCIFASCRRFTVDSEFEGIRSCTRRIPTVLLHILVAHGLRA